MSRYHSQTLEIEGVRIDCEYNYVCEHNYITRPDCIDLYQVAIQERIDLVNAYVGKRERTDVYALLDDDKIKSIEIQLLITHSENAA